MVKQCPRCWEKVSPEDEVCPHCGYDFAARRRAAQEPEAPKEERSKKSLFPTPGKKRKEDGDIGLMTKLVSMLVVAWAVLALAGGVYNLVCLYYLQGAGFLASGVLAAVAFNFIRLREKRMLAAILVLLSGAASLNIALLVVSLAVSYLTMCCKPDFKS